MLCGGKKMKKISMILLSFLVVVLLTGCSENKMEEKEQELVCTTTENEDGMNIEQVVSMTYKNDKLNHMTLSVKTAITDSTIKENWDMFKETMAKDNEEFNKDGVSLTVSVNDQNYEYNTTLDIDIPNASDEILKEQGFEGLKEDESTLEESKEAAEKDGATCEIK